MLNRYIAAMFFKSASRCFGSFSRISTASNLLRSTGNIGKSGANRTRKVSTLSTTLQSRLLKGTLSKNSSLLVAQEKYGKLTRNFCAISAACDIPQALVGIMLEAGVGAELQDDDEEMSSVSGNKEHRRKQKY